MREDFWWTRDRVLRTFPDVDPQDLARARIYDQNHQPIATPGEEWHRDQVTQLKDRDEADDILRVREIWSRRLRRRMVLVDGLDYFDPDPEYRVTATVTVEPTVDYVEQKAAQGLGLPVLLHPRRARGRAVGRPRPR